MNSRAILQATYHMWPSLKIVYKKLGVSEVVRAPGKTGVIIRSQWVLHGEYSCPWQIAWFGSGLHRKQKRKLFFYLHDFVSLRISRFILNYVIECLHYEIKMFWSVNSTFLGQFYSFFILYLYYNFQPMPLYEID